MIREKSILLLCCLMLAACRPKPSPTIVIDPALITLVPADTIFLAGARMDPIRSTEVYKKYVLNQKIGMLDEFTKKTGLDPRSDLWEFLIAGNGKETIVMARGHFSEMGLEPKLNIEGAQRFTYKGFTLLGDEAGAVVFTNSSTAIAGPTKALRRLIDHRSQPDSGAPKWLTARAAAIPSTSQIWFVGSVAGQFSNLASNAGGQGMDLGQFNPGQFLDALQLLTAQIDLQTGVKAHAEGLCVAETDARRLNDALRAGLGLARLSTGDSNPQLLRLIDGAKVLQQQKAVLVDINWPLSAIDELMKLTPALNKR
ncbi:MAG TPA: hypothetical protein VK604_18020 [Bryobacteraceae bacterium]|nr:hypothetical protein [Bryobacteraceae bacterium]